MAEPRVGWVTGTVREYDVVVLGAGSGRVVLSRELGHLRTAIVDSGPYGGTCLNRGCIPSKMFLHVAEVAGSLPGLNRLGVEAHVDDVRWGEIRDRVFGRIDPYAAAGPDQARRFGIDAYVGAARFVGPRRLKVAEPGGEVELRAEQVVLALGANPVVPQVISESGVAFHTSDTVMRLPALPDRLLILGGGVVGTEMAQLFWGLGVAVTIVTTGQMLVKGVGPDIGRRFTDLMARRWSLHLESQIDSVEQRGDGVHARLQDGTPLVADLLLVAAGRRPRTADIGLDLAGVAVDPDTARVLIDACGRTSAEGVWALGDVAGERQLKHLANDQARTIRHNLLHPESPKPLRTKAIPAAVFSEPQLAFVGMTVQQAREAGHDAVAYTQRLGDTAYGWALEDTTSVCTVVAQRGSGVVLGAQLMAPQASSLIQPLIDATARGLRAGDVAGTQMWIHPAATEVVENALIGVARAAAGAGEPGT